MKYSDANSCISVIFFSTSFALHIEILTNLQVSVKVIGLILLDYPTISGYFTVYLNVFILILRR